VPIERCVVSQHHVLIHEENKQTRVLDAKNRLGKRTNFIVIRGGLLRKRKGDKNSKGRNLAVRTIGSESSCWIERCITYPTREECERWEDLSSTARKRGEAMSWSQIQQAA